MSKRKKYLVRSNYRLAGPMIVERMEGEASGSSVLRVWSSLAPYVIGFILIVAWLIHSRNTDPLLQNADEYMENYEKMEFILDDKFYVPEGEKWCLISTGEQIGSTWNADQMDLIEECH